MVKKEYGKHIANYKWCSNGALVDRCLEIYLIKSGVKALLWYSGRKGWREEQYQPIWRSNTFPYNNNGDVNSTINKVLDIVKEKYNMPDNINMETPFHEYGTLKSIHIK